MTQVTKLGPGGYPVGILGPVIPTLSYVSLVEIIAAAWQPPDPLPTLPRTLAALSTSIINSPQFEHWERTATASEVVAANQPEVWPSVFERGGQQPYAQGQLAALSTSVINSPQPNADAAIATLSAILQSQPDVWPPVFHRGGRQPYEQGKLAALASSIVNRPTPNEDALSNLMEQITGAWQPPDPLPTLAQKRAPGSGLSVDNPPTLVRIFLPPVDDVFPAQPLPKLVPIAVAGQVAYAPQAFVPLLAWQLTDPLPTLPKQLAPGIPGQSVDRPPPAPAQISMVLQWQPPDFTLPTRTLLAALPGMSVDNPPGLRQLFLLPDDPGLIIQPRSQVAAVTPAVAAAFLASQPSWLTTVVQAWAPPDPAPQVAIKLPPALIAVRVDNPPFIIQGRFADIWTAWEPPPPLPQQGPLIVTPGPIIIVSSLVHNLPFMVTLGKLKAF